MPASPSSSWSRVDLWILAALILIAVAYRVATAQMIETGGDALGSWAFAKGLTLDGLLTQRWHHGSVRHGINAWVIGFQRVFGEDPVVYYFAPLLMSVAGTAFVYLTCRRAVGPVPAILASICLVLHPQLVRNGSQILPGIFSGAYVAATVYFITRCFEPRLGSIDVNRTVAALIFFAAYLSKIPNLFFLPAFTLAIWSVRRSPRDVVQFLGLLLLLFLLEWTFYAIVAGANPLGRLGIILGAHSSNMAVYAATIAGDGGLGWLDLFLIRYSVHQLGGPAQAWALYGAIAASVYLILRMPNLRSIKTFVAYAVVSFVLINGAAVQSLDPLVPVQKFHARYLAVLAPLTVTAIAFAAADIAGLLGRNIFHADGTRRGGVLTNVLTGLLVLPVVLLFLAANRDDYVLDATRHPYVVVQDYLAVVERGVADCIPFVMATHKDYKALRSMFVTNLVQVFHPSELGEDGGSVGFPKECRSRYPEWHDYLASRDPSAPMKVIWVSRFDNEGNFYWTIEPRQVALSMFADGVAEE